MSKHTPGPWEVEHDLGDGTPIVTFEARNIATVETYFGDGEANARLIAAAPELLDFIETVAMGNTEYDSLIAIAKSLIARAEGRE